jgi:hypothetical protein
MGNQSFKILLEILYCRLKAALQEGCVEKLGPTLGSLVSHRSLTYSQMVPGPYASRLTKAKFSCKGPSATGNFCFVRRHGVVGISVGPVQVQ